MKEQSDIFFSIFNFVSVVSSLTRSERVNKLRYNYSRTCANRHLINYYYYYYFTEL